MSFDAWHHVAFVLCPIEQSDTQTQATLYLDGAKIADGKAPLLGAHPGESNLGRSGNTAFHDGNADNPGHYFSGRLDDFRLLNRGLSEAEVRNLAK